MVANETDTCMLDAKDPWGSDDAGKEFSCQQAAAFLASLEKGTLSPPLAVIPYCGPVEKLAPGTKPLLEVDIWPPKADPAGEEIWKAVSFAYEPIERREICVRTLIMGASSWTDRMNSPDVLDLVPQEEWVAKGCKARIWGAYIILVDQDLECIYVLGNDEPPTYTVLKKL